MGDMKIAPYDVWQAITGNGDAMSNMVVNKFRMPLYFNCYSCRNRTCCSRMYFTRARSKSTCFSGYHRITGGASVAVVLFLAIFSDKIMR